jgi:hypothetical protein
MDQGKGDNKLFTYGLVIAVAWVGRGALYVQASDGLVRLLQVELLTWFSRYSRPHG